MKILKVYIEGFKDIELSTATLLFDIEVFDVYKILNN